MKMEMIGMKQERKKDIKFIVLFIIIVSFSFLYLFQTSLAKYRKQINGNITSEIAKWNILVNEEDIRNKTTLTNDIVPEFEGDEWTKDSVIAPGSTGYYDLIIDGSNVDVDFQYEIISTTKEESSIPDLKTIAYTINPETNNTLTPYSEVDTIKGTIQHNSTKTNIRIYIQWDDGENQTMDNAKDTEVATTDTSKVEITVTIKFSQIKD